MILPSGIRIIKKYSDFSVELYEISRGEIIQRIKLDQKDIHKLIEFYFDMKTKKNDSH